MKEGVMFCDRDLSCRLERVEGMSCAAFVDARARVDPHVGACRVEVGGTMAMFDGPASPVTQTFGLGMFDEVRDDDLRQIESFFMSKGAPVFHEVSPMADAGVLGVLAARGYQPIELTSVMYRPLGDAGRTAVSANPRVSVRVIAGHEHDVWARTSAEGWGASPELAGFVLDLSRVAAAREGGVSFLAEIDGVPVAAAGLSIFEGVALMAGASTIPTARNQGAQLALLDARLHYAIEHGCELLMMCALPGSSSQRNAERHGFRIAYTRIKWQLRP